MFVCYGSVSKKKIKPPKLLYTGLTNANVHQITYASAHFPRIPG